MGRKKHSAEEIIAKLRQVEVLVSQTTTITAALRASGLIATTMFDGATNASEPT